VCSGSIAYILTGFYDFDNVNVQQALCLSSYEFLLEKIPGEARVVLLPAGDGINPLDNTPVMQFFLAPRRVFNCTEADCLKSIRAAGTVAVLNATEQRAGLPQGTQVLDFDESWGMAVLDAAMPLSGTPLPAFGSLLAFLQALILPTLWLGLLVLSGTLILGDKLEELPASLQLAYGAGFGFSLLSLGLALGWLAGLRVAATTTIFFTVGLAGWASWSLIRNRPHWLKLRLNLWINIDPWLAVILILGAVSAALSVGRGFAATDEVLLWGAKGRGLAASGDLSQITQWGTNTVPYPLHIPILIAACELLFAEGLAAYKLIPALYGTSLAVLVNGFLARWGVRRWLAGLSSLAMLSAPVWFRHTTLAYANLPMVFALAAGCLLLVDELAQPAKASGRGRLALSGTCFAFAAWTRPEGWILGLCMMAAVWAAAAWLKPVKSPAPAGWQRLSGSLAPVLAYGVFWLLLQGRAYAGFETKAALIPAAAAGVFGGNLHLEALLNILAAFLRRFFSLDAWGLWSAGLLLCLVVGFARKAWSFQAAALASAGALAIACVLGMYYVTSFDTVKDLSWWISTGMERMLMPGFLLLWLAGMAAFARREEGND
jgi:hypothetical protein